MSFLSFCQLNENGSEQNYEDEDDVNLRETCSIHGGGFVCDDAVCVSFC